MSSKQEHPIQAMGFWLFELIDPVGRINGYASMEFSSADYLLVQRVRTVLQRQVDRLFDEFDVLATAGESSVASLLNAPPEEDSEGPIERRAPDACVVCPPSPFLVDSVRTIFPSAYSSLAGPCMTTSSSKPRIYFSKIRIGTDNVRPSNNPRHFMLLESRRIFAAGPKPVPRLSASTDPTHTGLRRKAPNRNHPDCAVQHGAVLLAKNKPGKWPAF